MDWDWQREWTSFEHSRLMELRGSPGHGDPVARLWCLPTFEPCLSWTIESDVTNPEAYVLNRTKWDRIQDQEKFSPSDPLKQLKTRVDIAKGIAPIPSITTTEATISAERLNAILAQGKDIRIPLMLLKDSHIGLDGVAFGFASGTRMRSCTIEWWGDGPQEWQPFIAWWHQLQNFVEGQFDSR